MNTLAEEIFWEFGYMFVLCGIITIVLFFGHLMPDDNKMQISPTLKDKNEV